jgi:hypothetical protein
LNTLNAHPQSLNRRSLLFAATGGNEFLIF